jgi:DNA-3-methyladenine glycosylase
MQGHADAVLIRAIEPITGIALMCERRGFAKPQTGLTTGPGKLSKAMAITKEHNGIVLWGDTIWIEDAPEIKQENVVATTRIGVGYAGADAKLPWRFYLKNSPWISAK